MKGIVRVVFMVVYLAVFGHAPNPESSPIQLRTNENCTRPNNETGICIPLKSCTELYNISLSRPLSKSNEKLLALSQCNYDYNTRIVFVCCATSSVSPAVGPSTSQAGGAALLPSPPQCGVSLSDPTILGTATDPDEFPWMAIIEHSQPGNVKGHYCLGALINNRYVLTAAHCINGRVIPRDWRVSGVRLGEWNYNTNPDCVMDARQKQNCAPPHITVPVEERIPHPQYEPAMRNQPNDIALLRLAQNVQYSKYIQPICLPSENAMRTATFTDEIMHIAGWDEEEPRLSNMKELKANVTVWDMNRCQQQFTFSGLDLISTQMCAVGDAGIDICRGNSGGPLMVEQRLGRVLVSFIAGVISIRPRSHDIDHRPCIYTRVGPYIDWIQQNVRT